MGRWDSFGCSPDQRQYGGEAVHAKQLQFIKTLYYALQNELMEYTTL